MSNFQAIKKQYSKGTSKPFYMPHKKSENNLVAIRKSKVTLIFNKHAYIRMFVEIKQSINVRTSI